MDYYSPVGRMKLLYNKDDVLTELKRFLPFAEDVKVEIRISWYLKILQCAILLKTIRKKVLFQQYFRSRKSGLTAIWTEKSMRLISIVYIITILM